MENTVEHAKNPALQKAPVKKFTLASLKREKPVSKALADLEWRLKFSEMKLNSWSDLENDKWVHLKEFQASTKAELSQHRAA